MARYRKKRMSLYEAMTQSRRKTSYGKTLEKLSGSPPAAGRDEHPQKTEQESAMEKTSIAMPKMTTTRWRRPRTVQFNTGRIEFSMSYPVATAILLGIILLILLAFRVGQYHSFLGKQPAGDNPAGDVSGKPQSGYGGLPVATRSHRGERPDEKKTGGMSQDLSTRSAADKSATETKVELAKPTGPATPEASNVIVIVEYSKRADLAPVRKHFAQSTIETEIVNWGGKYFLITKDRFEGFGLGSDGYQAKQKIVEVGAKYKAPQGYETFAPLFFKDAYGRKVE